MGKVGSFAEADLERKSEVFGSVESLRDPVGFRSHEEGGEIEEIGFGLGEFEIRHERIDEGESFATGGSLGSGISLEEKEVGTAGEATGGAEPGLDAELAGGEIDSDEVGFFTLTRGKEGGGLVGRGAIASQEGAESEVPEMEGGVVHAFPASWRFSDCWIWRVGLVSSR